MRRFVYVLMLCVGVAGLVACSVDTDNEATATIQYEGYCDSVVFVHPEDSVYKPYILKVISSETTPLAGPNSVFTETATTKDEYYQNAVYNCNIKAMKTYESMLQNVPARVLRNSLETTYGDSIDVSKLGYFTIYYSLYGFYDMKTVQVGTTHKDY